jgi:hypothetical protein
MVCAAWTVTRRDSGMNAILETGSRDDPTIAARNKPIASGVPDGGNGNSRCNSCHTPLTRKEVYDGR